MRLILLFIASASIVLPAAGQVVINEFNCGTPDFVEIRNLSTTTSVDVSGWSVESYQSNGGTPSYEGQYTLPAGTILPPRGEFVLEENGTAGAPATTVPCGVQTGYNYNWNSTRNVIVILRQGGTAHDYVYRNNNGSGPGGAPSLPAGTSWSGAFTASGNACSRLTDADTNNGADWTTASNASPCADNPGQTALPPPVNLSIQTTGIGDINAQIVTVPAIPGGEFWNLVSFQDYTPTGSGPLFGVGLDVLPQISGPIGTIFHNNLNGSGQWGFIGGGGTIPPGLFCEVATVVFDQANNVVVSSNVVEVQF